MSELQSNTRSAIHCKQCKPTQGVQSNTKSEETPKVRTATRCKKCNPMPNVQSNTRSAIYWPRIHSLWKSEAPLGQLAVSDESCYIAVSKYLMARRWDKNLSLYWNFRSWLKRAEDQRPWDSECRVLYRVGEELDCSHVGAMEWKWGWLQLCNLSCFHEFMH